MRGRNKLLITGLALMALLPACATMDSDDPANIKKTHYTLKLGDTVPSHQPLPAKTNIEVTWYYSNGATETVSGYRGWDFDGDKRFEMVEVLTAEGQVQSRVYDFDADGRIDLVQ